MISTTSAGDPGNIELARVELPPSSPIQRNLKKSRRVSRAKSWRSSAPEPAQRAAGAGVLNEIVTR
jgi:hypothetical protein